MTQPFDVLLLDFGGVCLVSPVEIHHIVERHLDLEPGTLTWRGPLDPTGDELYAQSIGDGGITERDYWAQRAAEVGRLAGLDEPLDTMGYMRIAYDAPGDELVRPEAVAVAEAARAAGLGVSVLTNDLRAFHGDEWVARIEFLATVDHVIDCSHAGYLKPDPRAYERALAQLGDPDPARVLFVDDQPLNVSGAEALGITSQFFDIADAAGSWKQVVERLGL